MCCLTTAGLAQSVEHLIVEQEPEGMGSIPGAGAILRVFNPLSPKIQIQILQTDLHTFPLRIVERIWLKIKVFSLWSSI